MEYRLIIGRPLLHQTQTKNTWAVAARIDTMNISKEDKPVQRKLLVLDVNGLLVDVVKNQHLIRQPDYELTSSLAVFKRPFVDEFLQFCFDNFDVGVWSTRGKENLDRLLDFLMGSSRQKLLFCWDRSHCSHTGLPDVRHKHLPMLVKELRKVWEKFGFNESNTLLLDDSPYKAILNPANTAIFPYSYEYANSRDSSLGPGGDLRVYLENLALADNVQKYVEHNPFGQSPIKEGHPSWEYLREAVAINASR